MNSAILSRQFLEREKVASSMNPQFWLYWIGVVTVG
jgi:hypothetical protein